MLVYTVLYMLVYTVLYMLVYTRAVSWHLFSRSINKNIYEILYQTKVYKWKVTLNNASSTVPLTVFFKHVNIKYQKQLYST